VVEVGEAEEVLQVVEVFHQVDVAVEAATGVVTVGGTAGTFLAGIVGIGPRILILIMATWVQVTAGTTVTVMAGPPFTLSPPNLPMEIVTVQ